MTEVHQSLVEVCIRIVHTYLRPLPISNVMYCTYLPIIIFDFFRYLIIIISRFSPLLRYVLGFTSPDFLSSIWHHHSYRSVSSNQVSAFTRWHCTRRRQWRIDLPTGLDLSFSSRVSNRSRPFSVRIVIHVLQVKIGLPRPSGTNSGSGAINTPGLSNPEISSELPYFLAEKSAPPTEFGAPPETYVGRGAPTPLNSKIPLWSFGRYNGYPQQDTVDLRDPMTLLTQYYMQPRFNCATPGKTLYCCFPGETMCEACEF